MNAKRPLRRAPGCTIAARAAFLALWGLPAAIGLLGCGANGEAHDELLKFSDLKDPRRAPPRVAAAARAVVYVTTFKAGGTAFFVSDGRYLVTNNHVLGTSVCPREGCYARIYVGRELGTAPSRSVPVRVVPLAVSAGYDIMVARVEAEDDAATPFLAPASLGVEDAAPALSVGTHLHVIGHPGGTLKKWSSGEVVAMEDRWITTDALSLPGSSGSPALDGDGRLVGILHRGGGASLTRRGVNQESVLSPAAAISALVEAARLGTGEGLEALRSIASPSSEADALDMAPLLASARIWTVPIGPMEVPLLDLLGRACDTALLALHASSLEEIAVQASPCIVGIRVITCQLWDHGRACPPGVVDDRAWARRAGQVADVYFSFNGERLWSWVTVVPDVISARNASGSSSHDMDREALLAAAARWDAPLDLPLAVALLSVGEATYHETDLASYVRDYRAVPHHERWAQEIAEGLITLVEDRRLAREAGRQMLIELLDDAHIELMDYLHVEDMAYWYGWL